MTTEGTVYDLGYVPHEGERLGRGAVIRAMIIDGARRSLGLRRKPWAKVLPWGLVAAAIVPAVWLVGLTFVISGFEVEDLGPFASPHEFFQFIGTLYMLFVALVTPNLLIPDRRYGVLSVYASRPIRAGDYLTARVTTITILSALYILIPHATMYIGVSALNENGIWAGLTVNASEIPGILGTTVAFIIAYVAPAILISLYVGRVAFATGVYVVVMMMSGGLADAIPRVSELLVFKILAPFSLFFNPFSVRDWFFDEIDDGLPLESVGLEPWVGAIAILVVAAATGVLAVRQYRKEM